VASDDDINYLKNQDLSILKSINRQLEIEVSGNLSEFISYLSKCTVLTLDTKTQSLEDTFMNFYKVGETHE